MYLFLNENMCPLVQWKWGNVSAEFRLGREMAGEGAPQVFRPPTAEGENDRETDTHMANIPVATATTFAVNFRGGKQKAIPLSVSALLLCPHWVFPLGTDAHRNHLARDYKVMAAETAFLSPTSSLEDVISSLTRIQWHFDTWLLHKRKLKDKGLFKLWWILRCDLNLRQWIWSGDCNRFCSASSEMKKEHLTMF